MAIHSSAQRAPRSLFDQFLPLTLLVAFFGIPGCAAVALVFSLQLPRMFYGEANPLLLAAELISLLGVLFLILLLRFALSRPSAPTGFVRIILDFFAMARWHPAVITALVCILVIPQLWFLRASHYSVITIILIKGRQALQSSDVRDDLDRILATFQLSLTAAVPLLFALHMLARWKPNQRWLPWLLIPVLIVSTAVGFIILGTIGHLSQ